MSAAISNNPTFKVIFRNKKFFELLILLVVLACLKLLLSCQFELDSEEAQYWIWSKHLQLSYYSKPPLIAYINWFSTSIFGNTVFAIRINAVIIGLLISLVSYILAYEIFKDLHTAMLSAVLANIFPFYLLSSLFFTTDCLLILFWLLGVLFYWKAVESGKPSWWILFGISIGMGALSKYSIFFIVIPLLIFSMKYHRHIFRSPWFYLSILISILFFLPVIFWNISHHALGLRHLIYLAGFYDHTTSSGQIITNVLQFFFGQVVLILPFCQYREIFQKYRHKVFSREEEFLLLPAIGIFFFFLIVSVFRRSGVYINWTMFAYSGLPLLFSHSVINGKQLKAIRAALVLTILGLFLFFFLISPVNKILPLGKLNPLSKRVGWLQLASKIDSIKTSLPDRACYIFSTNYHITSELGFYLSGQPPTYYLNLHARMTQFDLWQGTEQFMNSDHTGILVELSRINPEIKSVWQAVLKEDSCLIFYQQRLINTYYIYVVQGLKGFEKQPSSY